MISAIKAQNARSSRSVRRYAAGERPAAERLYHRADPSRKSADEFSNILLKVNQTVRRFVCVTWRKLELGGENYDIVAKFNNQPASGLGIKLATGANAPDTANAIRAELAKMEPYFPSGLKIVYPYDTTPFVKISIHEVVKTLVEAIILVFVMYLFLQNFRATLIPTIAVPGSLAGYIRHPCHFGFSINTLTMFGMVLAIGLLVDDAIVVVENVERVMAEEGLPPKEATCKSMGQIQGALVGIAMVLSAVFIPMASSGFNGCDLSSVLHHYRFGDGAVGAGCINPDPGAVRHDAENLSLKAVMASTKASLAGLTACSIRARTITPIA